MADPEKDENHQKQYKIFMTKLFKFHEQNGTPIKRLPLLGGKELDLYHLYQKVQSLGGSEQVTRNRQWGEVARSFNLPPSVTSASYAIRQHFVKLLERYEQLENDLVYGPASTSGAALLQLGSSVAMYHSTQPAASSLTSVTMPTPTPVVDMAVLKYDRLIRSLTSGFPNEVDFAFNVLTILSHERSLPIEKLPHLLNLMLAHVGVFNEDDQELEGLHYESWYKDVDMDFTQFWEKSVPWSVLATIFASSCDGVSDEDGMLFSHVSHEVPEAFRVTQLMNIVCNLSFEGPCAQALAEHEGLRRLILLCINNIIPPIQTLAFDVLANISSYMLVPYEGVVSVEELLLGSVHQSILCPDKHSVIRGLEILSGLAWCLDNEAALLATPPEVYQYMFRLLLVPDCELMLSSLEALYTLSMYSAEVAERLAGVAGCVALMVTMSTTEVGEDAMRRVKVTSSSEDTGGSQATPQPEASKGTPLHHVQSRPLVATPPATPTGATTGQSSPNSLLLALLPKPGLSPEPFTRQWLQTCYEAASGECVQQMELYANYLIYCSQVGQSSILTSNEFTALLKKVFPNSLSARVTMGTQAVLVIAGLRKRRLPLVPPKSASSTVPVSSSVTSAARPLQPQATLRNAVASPLVVASKAQGVATPNHVTLLGQNQVARSTGIMAQPNHVMPAAVGVGQKVSSLVQEKCQTGDPLNSCSDGVLRMEGNNSTLDGKMECQVHSGTVMCDDLNGNKENDVCNVAPEPAQKKMKPDEQDSGALQACCWDGCSFSADSRTGLFCHVVFTHISSVPSFPCPCLWSQCASTAKRTKSSLTTHIKVHHCKLYPPGHTNHYVPSVTNTLAKLKSLPPLELKEESVATKAVRLTSALILRNLTRLVPSVRSELQRHELWLSEAALSDCEASTALAQCLSLLSS